MKEKAYIFFTLLNEMYKIIAEEQLLTISAVSVPYMKKDDYNELINTYRRMKDDIIDLDQEFATPEQTKSFFNNLV